MRKTLVTLLAIASSVAAFGSVTGVAAADAPSHTYQTDAYSGPGYVNYGWGCYTNPSVGSVTCDQSARASTSAKRASPLSVATSAGSSPRIDHFGVTSRSARAASSAIVDWVASTSPSAGSTSRM